MVTKSNKLSRVILGLLLVVIILLGLVWFLGQKNNILEFIALDVGQGDAILIKTPYEQNILIDGGPDNSVIYRLGKNLPFYDRTIDLMVLTHPDPDHLTGLIEVLKRFKVKKVLLNSFSDSDPNCLIWQKLIKEKGIEQQIGQAGQVINFGQDLEIKILYPEESYFNRDIDDFNVASLILKLVYKNTSFLLMGDAPKEAEERLILKGVDLKVDVLKVGHHGSKNSSGLDFVKMVSPKYAIISVGLNNRFGHPTRRVLKTLKEFNVEILRTDEMGDIIFKSDGHSLSISGNKKGG